MLRRLAIVACSMALLALSALPASAEPAFPSIPKAQMQVFATWFTTGLPLKLACHPERDADIRADWTRARDILLATLAASGYSGAFVESLRASIGGADGLTPPKVDCLDRMLMAGSLPPALQPWTDYVISYLRGLGLQVVEHPATPDQLAGIRTVFAAEEKLEARLFQCLEATFPPQLLTEARDWDQMLADTSGELLAAGLSRDDIGSLVQAAASTTLWHPTFPAPAPAVRDDCLADQAWQERYARLETHKLKLETTRILGLP